jgi:hypothetical protein
MPEFNTSKSLSMLDKILLFSVIILILLFIYCHSNINNLENEINKLESINMSINKTVSSANLNSSLNELNTNYIKNKEDIDKLNINSAKNKEDIDKLNTIITSYVNSSIQQINTNNIPNNESNNIDFYTQLHTYILENNEKLDNFISETNMKLDELEDSKNTILESITNINSKLS